MSLKREEFVAMQSELAELDQKREEFIITSRKLLKVAKKIIYTVHRNTLDEALIVEGDTLASELKECQQPIGAVRAALQEWVESVSYYTYVKEKRLVTKQECGVGTEDYLLGIADLTGELTRRSVLLSIEKDKDGVKDIRAFVDEVLGEFLSFDFRNGELRKKTDQIRWNLQKIEEMLV